MSSRLSKCSASVQNARTRCTLALRRSTASASDFFLHACCEQRTPAQYSRVQALGFGAKGLGPRFGGPPKTANIDSLFMVPFKVSHVLSSLVRRVRSGASSRNSGLKPQV